jgi:hypothetical protein
MEQVVDSPGRRVRLKFYCNLLQITAIKEILKDVNKSIIISHAAINT